MYDGVIKLNYLGTNIKERHKFQVATARERKDDLSFDGFIGMMPSCNDSMDDYHLHMHLHCDNR